MWWKSQNFLMHRIHEDPNAQTATLNIQPITKSAPCLLLPLIRKKPPNHSNPTNLLNILKISAAEGNITYAQKVTLKSSGNQYSVTIQTRNLLNVFTDIIKEVSECNVLKALLLATLSTIIFSINFNHG